jgi:hypothetical protein
MTILNSALYNMLAYSGFIILLMFVVTVRAQGSSPYKKAGGVAYASSGASTSPIPSKSKVTSDDLPKIQVITNKPSYFSTSILLVDDV